MVQRLKRGTNIDTNVQLKTLLPTREDVHALELCYREEIHKKHLYRLIYVLIISIEAVMAVLKYIANIKLHWCGFRRISILHYVTLRTVIQAMNALRKIVVTKSCATGFNMRYKKE